MPPNNLLLSKYILLSLLFVGPILYAQTPDGITSSVGKSYFITLCEGDSVTFTLDSFTPSISVGEEFIFYRIRAGVPTQIVQLQSKLNTYNATASTSSVSSNNLIRDGDKIYGRRLNLNATPPIISDTESITIRVLANTSSTTLYGGTIDQPDQVICRGGIPLDLTVTSTSSGPKFLYQWQRSSDNVNFSDITGANFEQFVMSSVSSTTYFRRRIRNAAGGSCEKYSTSHKVEVSNVVVTGGLITQPDQTICIGDSLNPIAVTGGSTGANIVYQWEQSIDGGLTYTDLVGESNPTVILGAVTRTTHFRRKTFSSVASCTEFSNDHLVNIVELLPGNLDTSQNLTICSNTIPPKIGNGNLGKDATSSVGPVSYQWQQSIDSVNWTDLASGFLSSYTPSKAITQTTWFRRTAKSSQGTLTCTRTTNPLRFDVFDETIKIVGDQIICENNVPLPLRLNGVSNPAGLTYQWQISNDNINFSNIASTSQTLSFSNLTPWTPTSTSFYRVIYSNSLGCTATSTVAEIKVTQKPKITQISAPLNQQYVCPGSAIVSLSFELENSSAGLSVYGIIGSGLTFSGPVSNVYTITGIPNRDVYLNFNAVGDTPCASTSLQYNIISFKNADAPTGIRKDVDNKYHAVFKNQGLWFNNTVCLNTSVLSTRFYACGEGNPVRPPIYEWKITPQSAGVINTSTGELTWNSSFSGTVTVSVRLLDCGGNSNWLDTPIEVLSSNTTSSPKSLTITSVLDDSVCGLTPTSIPECQITSATPDTHFFATTGAGVPDYQSILWSIDDVNHGGGVGGVSNPGTINSRTGEVSWNSGFWGSLNIVATPVSCDGNLGTPTKHPVNISILDDTPPSILTVSPTQLPICPPAKGEFTQFRSNVPVDWSIDNLLAGRIVPIDDFNMSLEWAEGFSGSVNLTASSVGSCTVGETTELIFIEGEAKIIPPLITNLMDVKICEGTFLNPIEYEIEGFPTAASVVGLPLGISQTFSSTHHIVDIVYTGTGIHDQIYTIEIHGQNYSYTLSGTQSADDLVRGLTNAINSFSGARITADRAAPNTLRIKTKVPGFNLRGTVQYRSNYISVAGIYTVQSPKRTITLTGTVTAAPGVYDYEIIASGGAGTANCSSTSLVARITVTGLSSITLDPASDDKQAICFGDPIKDINYFIQNSSFANVTGLPQGMKEAYNSVSQTLRISGTPSVKVTQTTVYTYTVNTQNNSNGCSSNATVTGTITLYPNQEIRRISAFGTDSQIICGTASSSLSPIIYQLEGGSLNYQITGVPSGVGVNYDPVLRQLTLTGRPSATITQTTAYLYSITSFGTHCNQDTVTGTITISPPPEIELVSNLSIANQINADAVCVNSPIVPILFDLKNASTFQISGLPNGVFTSLSGNRIKISGTPTVSVSNTTRFNYIVTPLRGTCPANTSFSGYIDVVPLPEINAAFITNNDITHVSCNGLQDGSITIPTTSPDFDLRIKGGQNAIAQKDRVELINQPILGDVYSIILNGITYSHTVVASSFGGVVETPDQVAQQLVKEINQATGVFASPVTASYQTPSSLELVADVPGFSYSVSTTISTTYSGAATPTIAVSNVVPNVNLNFVYKWTGPNGFTSSNLSISNLEAGNYSLEVSYGKCTSSPVVFTINEPDPVNIVTDTCNGGLKTTITGGVAPYTVRLFDSGSNLLQTNYTTSIQNFSGLIPGANYLIEVLDSSCSLRKQLAIKIPYNLTFDPSIPLVVDDYCNDGNGDGFIQLGGNSGGNAFSGGSNQFSYSWRGGPNATFQANTRDIYDLEPGVYTVTVTDLNLGCTDQESFTVGSVNQLVITPTTNTVFNANGKIDLACNGDQTALLEATVSGGLGNYTYSWLKDGVALAGKNKLKLENVGVGKYTLVVKDAPPTGISSRLTSCVSTYRFEVVEPDPITLILNSGTATQTYCPGDTASIGIEIVGGVPPFTVKLNDGNGGTFIVPNNKPFTYSKINPSTTGPEYKISLEDANGCVVASSSKTTVSFETAKLVGFRGKVTPIDCVAGNLGSIDLEIVSGKIDEPKKVQVEWISSYGHWYHTWDSNKGKLENIEHGGNYKVVINYGGCELYTETFTINDQNDSVYLNTVNVNGGGCNGELGSISLDIQGGYPPYTIEWQKFKSETTVNSTGLVSTTTTSTSPSTFTTQLAWVTLRQYENNAAISELESGAYRAIVRDASQNSSADICSESIVTDVINIGENTFEIKDVVVRNAKSCTNSETNAEIEFSVLNTLPNTNNVNYELEISLDAKDPKSDLIRINSTTYKIVGIKEGSHTLLIKTGTTSQVLGEYAKCSIVHSFKVEKQLPITYEGPTEIDLDNCGEATPISIDSSQISGGIPFEINSSVVYDYRWIFTPLESDSSTGNTQIFVGHTISNAQAGSYELTIRDSLGCESDPILFTVNPSKETLPFSISGTLINNEENGDGLVKSLPPTCTQENDGQIGISIEGGSKPYTIEWLQEQIIDGNETTSSTTEFVSISRFSNGTYLNNLAPGKYRVRIKSLNQSCGTPLTENSHLFYQEDIIIPKNNELYVVDGPYVDDNLCQLNPGKLLIEVFDNQSGDDLTFYYNKELVTFEKQKSSTRNKFYTVYIENPVQSAELVITNKNGCRLTEQVLMSEIGIPEFSYNTPSLETEGVILAKEEITFTNTSEPPYSYSEWYFGDGTDSQMVETESLINPIRHAYGIAGTYWVTLRNYSALGCYKEYNQQIVVGKGYNIIAPNAFTPNGDLYNDVYRLLFSGFEKVTFKIYDQRGDLLYSETVQQNQENATNPLQLVGWDGRNETGSSFYTYSFSGILITDQTEITKSGNFVLIK